jgi:23S rRNA (guanosine2251-2'-O)-methyltransferase
MIFGLRPLLEAIEAGRDFEKVLVMRGSNAGADLHRRLRDLGIPFQFVPPEKLDWLAHGNTHQGIIGMLSAVVYQDLTNLIQALYEDGKEPFIVLADSVTDVRNVGAIARSAEAFGAHALVVPARDSARLGPEAVKASSGALLHLPICRVPDSYTGARILHEAGLRLIALTEKSAKPMEEFKPEGPMALIVGAEDTGIDPELLAMADISLRIPIIGRTESLNVSVATGIALHWLTLRAKTSTSKAQSQKSKSK